MNKNMSDLKRDSGIFSFIVNRLTEFFVCPLVEHDHIEIQWKPTSDEVFDHVYRAHPKILKVCKRCWLSEKQESY